MPTGPPGKYRFGVSSQREQQRQQVDKRPDGAADSLQRPGPVGRGGASGREMGFVEEDSQSVSDESEDVEDGPHVPLSG